MITRESIEKRIADTEAAKQQHMANAAACEGAIQMAKSILAELTAPTEAPPTE